MASRRILPRKKHEGRYTKRASASWRIPRRRKWRARANQAIWNSAAPAVATRRKTRCTPFRRKFPISEEEEGRKAGGGGGVNVALLSSYNSTGGGGVVAGFLYFLSPPSPPPSPKRRARAQFLPRWLHIWCPIRLFLRALRDSG